MVRIPGCVRAVCVFLLLLAADVALAQTVNGFPNWEERVLHQWINRARVEPSVELADCGSNCSPAEMATSCYTPTIPLMWDYELALAARFHSASMSRQGFFAHDTPCTVRSNIKDLYPASCDGSEACGCSDPNGTTSPGTRVTLFGGTGYEGEIIAAGYANPDAAFYAWLHEPAGSASCSFSIPNGHRWVILKHGNSIGTGYTTGGTWGRYYSADFGRGGPVSKIPSGAHYPRQASTIEFWANWYDPSGGAPDAARVVVGSTYYPMTLERGDAKNGAWKATVNGLGTGCHRYYFEFLDSAGSPVRYPSSGTFGIGPTASCADFVEAVIAPPTLTATALTTTSVQVSWTSSSGATQYELQRSAAGLLSFAPLITTGGTGYVDNTALAGRTYLYRVRPVGGTTWSNIDHATTIVFTDDPLIANVTFIRAIHMSELRLAVNAVRTAAALPLVTSWTDSSLTGATVKATHILELRSALSAALTAIGKTSPATFSVSAGGPPRAFDLQELRDALR